MLMHQFICRLKFQRRVAEETLVADVFFAGQTGTAKTHHPKSMHPAEPEA
jgi:hypothetical protein